jgi:predicted RNA-binding Zn-ribbon protein involved in translation (DUF1610 family)
LTSEPKSTPAPFQSFDRRGLKRFNAIEILGVLLGLAAIAMGTIGAVVGIPLILAALYIGKCPHCGADMSATHYQTEADCPSCHQDVAVRDQRFWALSKPAPGKAA